jgi:hypothetical protein
LAVVPRAPGEENTGESEHSYCVFQVHNRTASF